MIAVKRPVVPAEVGPPQLTAGCTYVQDAELDGENLTIGQPIEVCDDAGRQFAAVVAGRKGRFWRLNLGSPEER